MRRVILFCAVLVLLAPSHANYYSPSSPPLLEPQLADRAGDLFGSLDANRDAFLDDADLRERRSVEETDAVVHRFMPTSGVEEVSALIELADTNHDGKLTRREFEAGLATGLDADVAASFVETRARLEQRRFLGKVGKAIGKGIKFVRKLFTKKKKAAAPKAQPKQEEKEEKKDGPTQDGCVVCQYLVERMETNIRHSGIFARMNSIDPNWQNEIMGNPSSQAASFLEVEQLPFEVAQTGSISSTRQQAHLQRSLEREKYNEIYRVADITLDDACEQGMPNSFYRYCKALYQVQGDIVDGLRYQYRATDICFKTGMCAHDSYITKGIHSRYKKKQGESSEGSKASETSQGKK